MGLELRRGVTVGSSVDILVDTKTVGLDRDTWEDNKELEGCDGGENFGEASVQGPKKRL